MRIDYVVSRSALIILIAGYVFLIGLSVYSFIQYREKQAELIEAKIDKYICEEYFKQFLKEKYRPKRAPLKKESI